MPAEGEADRDVRDVHLHLSARGDSRDRGVPDEGIIDIEEYGHIRGGGRPEVAQERAEFDQLCHVERETSLRCLIRSP